MKKILTLLLFFSVFLQLSAAKTVITDGTLQYEIDTTNQTATVIKDPNLSTLSGSITIPETVTVNSVSYTVTAIGNEAFRDCSALTAITIPSSVTAIGSSAFESCSKLTAINFNSPSSVTAIGGYAFCNCSALTSITIPRPVTSIGDFAFLNCSALTAITIPSSVTYINNLAFANCDALTELVFMPKTPPTTSSDKSTPLRFTAPNCRFYAPGGSIDAYKSAPDYASVADYPWSSLISQNQAYLKPEENIRLTPTSFNPDSVTWTSSNEAVATVDSLGNVTAKGVGNATITANFGTGSDDCAVFVEPILVESITLSHSAWDGKVGESLQLTATVTPENATDNTITWASSDEAVATVDSLGNVTAKGVGNATITATSNDGSGIKATCNVTVISVTLNKTEATLKAGESVQLNATVSPENTTDKTVIWSSSNDAIATVDSLGNVTAVAVGNATITATCDSAFATCAVTVAVTYAESVTINKTETTLKAGESVQLNATVAPETTTDKTVIWSSSNENVATVDSLGNVTAVAVGNATITATCDSVSATCAVTVAVTYAESVTLDKTETTLKAGESVQLTATVAPVTTTDKTVTWTSSNEAVATVDSLGNVTAVAVGNATITATCDSAFATCAVTVAVTYAESVTLDKTETTLKAGESVQLNATVAPETTTDKTVTWMSSNNAVATVDSLGNVTAIAVGNATITATCGSATATCAVTVAVTLAESVTLDKTEATLKAGESVQLTATVAPKTTTDKTITWSSSNEAVATVDSLGNVTAVAVGTATITATCDSATATCAVTVEPTLVESITLSQSVWAGKVGESLQLTATVAPENATDKTVTWASSNNAVATVDANGNVTIVAEGNATITATSNDGSGIKAECVITATSGVDSALADMDSFDIYSADGRALVKDATRDDLKKLGNGIYILKTTTKTIKVVIR